MAVSTKIWDLVSNVDLDTADLAEGRLTIQTLDQAKSVLFRLVGFALTTYTQTKLSETEQTELDGIEEELADLAVEFEQAKLQAYIENRSAEVDPKAPDFMDQLAKLQAEYAQTLLDLAVEFEQTTEEKRTRQAELQGMRGSASLDRVLKELHGSRPNTDPKRDATKLAFWTRDWTMPDLLKTSDYKGVFRLNGPDRELWFYPTGKNWQAANSYAKAETWIKLGALPDHTDLSKPTHVPRFGHRMIYVAGEYTSLADLFSAVCRTYTEGSGVKGTPSFNAGGVVPLHLIGDVSEEIWPKKRQITEAEFASQYHWTDPKAEAAPEAAPEAKAEEEKPKPKK